MICSNYSDFENDGTTIQMFPSSAATTEIDKQIAIQLIQAAVELIKPSANGWRGQNWYIFRSKWANWLAEFGSF